MLGDGAELLPEERERVRLSARPAFHPRFVLLGSMDVPGG
jgi:hypothetical protein